MALDALEARVVLAARDSLRLISPADGYRTRPQVVIGHGVQPPQPLSAPTIYVHDAEGSQAVRIVHQPPMWEHAVRFATEVWVPGGGMGDDDSRARELGNVVGDVRRRLLRADRTLGGVVSGSGVEEIRPQDTDEEIARPMGSARLDFVARVTTTEEES